MDYNVITVLGPTATGKTKLAVQIADYFNGEIISADSRQVYKGMNLGTGKDYDDYIINNNKIPCYMIDIIEPNEEFNVFLFKELFNIAIWEIPKRVKLPVLCGGTGMYLSAAIQNYRLNKKNIHSKEELEKLSFEELKSLYFKLNKSPHNITDIIDRSRTITALMILQSKNDNYTDAGSIKSFTIGINPGRERNSKENYEKIEDKITFWNDRRG